MNRLFGQVWTGLGLHRRRGVNPGRNQLQVFRSSTGFPFLVVSKWSPVIWTSVRVQTKNATFSEQSSCFSFCVSLYASTAEVLEAVFMLLIQLVLSNDRTILMKCFKHFLYVNLKYPCIPLDGCWKINSSYYLWTYFPCLLNFYARELNFTF